MSEELKLTELISIETLQMIQEAFCDVCNLSIGISDENGVNITEDTLPSEFCGNYNKKSPIGRARCELCDKRGGELAAEKGKTVIYHCHAGLVDFAAPIIAHGKIVGNITGGQVRTEELDEAKLRKVAEEIQVNPDEYVEAAKKIRYISQSELKRTTKFLYKMSKIISDMAYDRYSLLLAKQEVEHAAQMKSDFLANVSHEIRTPMNAVIGMAEMALREELPAEARNYVSQIISSGKTLLTIINDVLDFSKIEAGKMSVEEEEYEIMSMINDVANIINTRIGDKDLELILDIDPDLPRIIVGDINRLKQVIINLANNAVKFTKEGQVMLKISFQRKSKEEILLAVSVKDTGIGIKREDIDKLFEAFQQLDSKRNRNVEGTGLGLTISQRLVSLMGGEIWVESTYGKGSTFSFAVPQKIVDATPSASVKNKNSVSVAGLVSNGFMRNHMERDMNHLGVCYRTLESEDELYLLEERNIKYLFIGQKMYSKKVEDFLKNHSDITGVLMIDFRNEKKSNIKNLLVIRKPVYVLNIAALLNGEDVISVLSRGSFDEFEFIAPEAEVLIVDDNVINLTVAEGLLKPLHMKIDKATGGKQAVEMISEKMYDIIFMDHMMPEIDGIEATHIIRRLHPEYDNVPIIALTANAVSGVKDMFIEEGMNDFVAKPIEMRTILSKLRTWLPKEKVQKVYNNSTSEEEAEVENIEIVESGNKVKNTIDIEGLDTDMALQLLGTEELFWRVLKDYYQVIEKKASLIKELEKNEDWQRYTIEVHALKSASKQIGATDLSEKALEMERAGNAKDAALIHKNTDEMLSQYLNYINILKPYFLEEIDLKDESELEPLTKEQVIGFFDEIRDALDDLDLEKVEELLKDMDNYRYDDSQKELFEELKQVLLENNVHKCEEIILKWEELLE